MQSSAILAGLYKKQQKSFSKTRNNTTISKNIQKKKFFYQLRDRQFAKKLLFKTF